MTPFYYHTFLLFKNFSLIHFKSWFKMRYLPEGKPNFGICLFLFIHNLFFIFFIENFIETAPKRWKASKTWGPTRISLFHLQLTLFFVDFPTLMAFCEHFETNYMRVVLLHHYLRINQMKLKMICSNEMMMPSISQQSPCQ